MKRYLLIGLVLCAGIFLRAPHANAACQANTNAIKVITRDANGTLLPGMNIAIYHKYIDPDGNPYISGGALATGQTDAGGQTTVNCVPDKQAPYAVKVYQKNPNFGYFMYWDISQNGPLLVSIVEVNLGGLQAIYRDAQGNLLKNVVFDVYLQSFDVDGNPVIDVTKLNADKLVASDFNTQVFGTTHVYLTPGHYVIRIHGTGNTYFYLWNQEVNAEEETMVEYHLATMRFVFLDGFGGVVKNQQFTIYRQIQDIQNQPIYGDVVAGGTTGTAGNFDAYLPTGTYALRIAGTGGTTYRSYNYSIAEEQYRVVSYHMSGVRLILRGTNNDLARTTRFSFATQRLDANGKPIVSTYLLKSKTTGDPGYVDLYVPAGTYLLLVGTNRVPQIDVFDRQFTSVDWPRTITFRVNSEISVVTPITNTSFTVRGTSARLPSYLGSLDRVTGVYRLRANSLRSTYKVVMSASQAKLDNLGVSASSLRMAFYSDRSKHWTLVGKRSKLSLSASFQSSGLVTLITAY